MTIAEKVTRAKADYDDVYDKAKKAFGVTETVSGIGEVVLSHVNSEAHKVNAVVESKNLFDISKANVTFYDAEGNEVTINDEWDYFQPNGDLWSFHSLNVVPGEKYTVRFKAYSTRSLDNLLLGFGRYPSYFTETPFALWTVRYGMSSDFVSFSASFTIPSDVTLAYVIAFSNTKFKDFQIERGTSATDYSPYVELSGINIFEESTGASYTPSSGGTLEIDSISPTMTVYSDNPDVRIECEYYQDGSAVKEELTNTIISLGGTI